MADKPIIFSAPMVRALLDGIKTQTRRVLKPQPIPALCWDVPEGKYPSPSGWSRIPYAPGDRLWVREGYAFGWPIEGSQSLPECNQAHAITYRADGNQPFGGSRWKSPIHMPRWASRLTLRVTDVRVQRLQEISEADAVAEGIKPHGHAFTGYGKAADQWMGPLDSFASLWISLHGTEGWDANPWVVAMTFTVQRGNIDQIGGA